MTEGNNKKKVMIVDDEPSIAKLAGVKLRKEGFEVIEANSGSEALDKVGSEKPDLIILDIMMPKMDGKEVYKRLQANPKTRKIPVIFLTAVGHFEDQLRGLSQDSVTEYFTKPFVPAELAQAVRAALGELSGEQLARAKSRKEAKLRTIVEIMRRDDGT